MDYNALFREDFILNSQNPRYDNDESFDNEYGERRNGFWFGNTSQGNVRITFDNGHIWEIAQDKTLLDYCDAGEAYFIDKDIELAMAKFCAEHNVGEEASRYEDEIVCKPFIRVVIHRQKRIVAIPTIYLHPDMQHKGLGKKAISIIYDICKRLNYRLHLVQLVESFYVRMLNRGAEVVVPYDTLEITDNTDLKY